MLQITILILPFRQPYNIIDWSLREMWAWQLGTCAEASSACEEFVAGCSKGGLGMKSRAQARPGCRMEQTVSLCGSTKKVQPSP